ncbi:AarF/ABC1/UbiB kinase family protein [Myxococcota bacterium]|nr:AarF/ABC1/UbiB kinase family protein [Myxococcota bacterium]
MSEEDDDFDFERHAPASGRKRFVKLASMTASVATGYAKSRLKTAFQSATDAATERARSYQESGERIAKTLGELKGAAMKIGQMASIQADILPKELSAALVKLQKEAPPMPFEVIAAQIERELGARPEQLFSRFDRQPFAAASIGQVHRARTDDGREVVVKVQYPGVDASVGSDLTHLKLALRASGLVRLDKRNLDALFEEISARLHEELDYSNEADNLRRFRDYHAKHPFVVVPKVVGERSSQRILTLTYEPGDHLHELDGLGYSQEVRDAIGRHLFILSIGQMFELRAIHADPNPANYAFRKDGTIVIYDFGCVKRLEDRIIEAYARTLWAAIHEDYAGVERGMLELGARRPDGPPIEPAYYKTWRDILLVPFLADGPFDYGASKIHEDVVAYIPSLLPRMSSFQAPVEVIFLDRVIGGQYGNLRKIRARGRFYELVREALVRALGPKP